MSKNEVLAGLARVDGGINVKNINGGPLANYRNKIINGDFDIWQRGTSQTAAGYFSDDRWINTVVGGTLTHSRQAFTLGQTAVPGEPTYFSRSVVAHAVGAANAHNKQQRLEGVRSLAGKTATLTFYAKADAPKNIAVEFTQDFGTGGSPSARIEGIAVQLIALTNEWQKFSIPVSIPSIAGKTIGSNGNDHVGLIFWFEAGSNFNARTANLGQQSGTFDIAHVSLVEGDATAEDDPFSPRHPGQELALCQRYFEIAYAALAGVAAGAGHGWAVPVSMKVQKRATPTASINTTLVATNLSSGTLDQLSAWGLRYIAVASAAGAFAGGALVNIDAEL